MAFDIVTAVARDNVTHGNPTSPQLTSRLLDAIKQQERLIERQGEKIKELERGGA